MRISLLMLLAVCAICPLLCASPESLREAELKTEIEKHPACVFPVSKHGKHTFYTYFLYLFIQM